MSWSTPPSSPAASSASRASSLSLQEMEEASCQARCTGLFRRPREVFLLGVQHAGDQGRGQPHAGENICTCCSTTASIAPPPSASSSCATVRSARASARRCAACSPACRASTDSPRSRRAANTPRRCWLAICAAKRDYAGALLRRTRRYGAEQGAARVVQGHVADPDSRSDSQRTGRASIATTSARSMTRRVPSRERLSIAYALLCRGRMR